MRIGKKPFTRLALCRAACRPQLSPCPAPPSQPDPVLTFAVNELPPLLPARKSPLDVGAKAIYCTQPFLELGI